MRKPNPELREFHQVNPWRTLETTTSYFTLKTLIDVKVKARSRGFGSNLSPLQLCSSMMGSGSGSLVWFRKGIRIHDNPALEFASRSASHLYPVFVIDPHYMKPDPNAPSPGSSRAGLNRIKFLLESLVDLDLNLKNLGSRLLILKGDPAEVVIQCLKEVSVISTIDFFLSFDCLQNSR